MKKTTFLRTVLYILFLSSCINTFAQGMFAKSAVSQILRLRVVGNNISDETILYFNENATDGYDNFDSPKMINGSTSQVPDLYTFVSPEILVINGMKTIPYGGEIPLYFKPNASTASLFTLSANQFSDFAPGTSAYIKNNLTQEIQLISDGSVYTFNKTDATLNPAFSVIFKAPGVITATSATNINTSGFTANWDPVADATGYMLDVSTSETFDSFVAGYNDLDVSGTSQALTGLLPNTTYYYRVRATSISGTSDHSNTITALTAFNTNVNISTLPLCVTCSLVVVDDGVLTNDASADRRFRSITVEGGGKLTNQAGSTLRLISLSLNSDANGTATYVDNGTSVITSAAVQQNLLSARNWYMSSPVAVAVIPTTGYTIYTYPENDANQAISGSSPITWTPGNYWLTPVGNFTVMKGYIVRPAEATTITFTGALNTGTKSISGLTYSSANPRPGYNLVGNPYPSYVNWNSATKTNLSNSMWYRTHDGSAWKFFTYNTIEGAGGIGVPSTVTNLIPPMQAFWVFVNEGQTGTLAFTNGMREHQDAAGSVFRVSAATPAVNKILRLQVAGEDITDEAVVYFNTHADNGYDAYDSPKMMNGAASVVPEIYTTAGNKQLVINGMNSIPFNTEIPLYFKSNASVAGSFSIIANQISNFEEGTTVFIKNNLTQETQLISDGSEFTFNTADATADPAFSLIIKAPGAITSLADNDNNNVKVYANTNRQITVTLPSLPENGMISVYNATGQKIYSGKVNKTTTVIENTLTPGVYVVNVNNVSKKVVVR